MTNKLLESEAFAGADSSGGGACRTEKSVEAAWSDDLFGVSPVLRIVWPPFKGTPVQSG